MKIYIVNKILIIIMPLLLIVISAIPAAAFDDIFKTGLKSSASSNICVNYFNAIPFDFDIVYSDLSIYPLQVTAGYQVTISALATNNGQNDEETTVSLIINEKVISAQTVIIHPKETVTVVFSTVQNITGDYSVIIGNVNGSFTVIEPIGSNSSTIYWEVLITLVLSCVLIVLILVRVLSKKNTHLQ